MHTPPRVQLQNIEPADDRPPRVVSIRVLEVEEIEIRGARLTNVVETLPAREPARVMPMPEDMAAALGLKT